MTWPNCLSKSDKKVIFDVCKEGNRELQKYTRVDLNELDYF